MISIDPLSCLREYTIKKKSIVEKNNFIIFGEYCWLKSVKTNYQVFRKQNDAAEEYYTLECLVFLLKNSKLNHVEYCNFAQKNNVPAVRRPDRKKLLAYLMGEISTSPSINTSAPVVFPTKIKLEQQDEITDASDANVQNSTTISSNKAGTSSNICHSSFTPSCTAVKVKAEIDDQRDINMTPHLKLLSLLSSTETNFSRNEKQFHSFQRAKQVKEDYRKAFKKQRTENSSTLSSSNASISRNDNDQRYFNHEDISISVKTEIDDHTEIDRTSNAENSSRLSSSEASNSRNDKGQRYFNYDYFSF